MPQIVACPLDIYTKIACLQDSATCAGLKLLEEVIALVVNQDEGGEVLYLNLPDGFHAQFGILYALDGLDVVLCQNSSRTTN